jgi:molybdopterin/thiamine biosynthesis adenylyltransferase
MNESGVKPGPAESPDQSLSQNSAPGSATSVTNGSDDSPQPSVRYARQIRFAPLGAQGQDKLIASSVVIAGMGALGCVLAQHMVRAGLGRVRLIDRDIVEWSNLQRQMLYTEEDVRRLLPKAEAAAAHLRRINSLVAVEPVVAELSAANADELLSGFDLILDGTDNFPVRYLLNEFSVKTGIPWMYGAAVGATGMSMAFIPEHTPCFSCLFPIQPAGGTVDTCETTGVISPIIDIVGSLQAAEAMKLLSGNEAKLHARLLQIDLWDTRFTPIDVSGSRNPDCPVCAGRQFPHLNAEPDGGTAASLCGRQTVQITPPSPQNLPLQELSSRLSALGPLERNPYLLRVALEDEITMVLFPDGRALFQGTEDPELARRLYGRIMGL